MADYLKYQIASKNNYIYIVNGKKKVFLLKKKVKSGH